MLIVTLHLLSYSRLLSFLRSFFFFFSTAPATTVIYTLSLHDALPIFVHRDGADGAGERARVRVPVQHEVGLVLLNRSVDRKSTRLNSSHVSISYAVFCLKKKKKKIKDTNSEIKKT